MVTLTLRHRGKRGIEALPTIDGEHLVLAPGQTGTGSFVEEYAKTLRARSAKGDNVEVVDEEPQNEQPPAPEPNAEPAPKKLNLKPREQT
jgi:hypothetical protein